MTVLCAYPWPGNIRELQNVVERAVILARGSVLELSDFELPSLGSESRRPARGGPGDERQQIEEALAASRGRVYGDGGAAEALGVPPSTLESRIRRLGIDKHAFRRRALRPASRRALTGSTAGGRRLCDEQWRPPVRWRSVSSFSRGHRGPDGRADPGPSGFCWPGRSSQPTDLELPGGAGHEDFEDGHGRDREEHPDRAESARAVCWRFLNVSTLARS